MGSNTKATRSNNSFPLSIITRPDPSDFDTIIEFTALASKLYSFTTRSHHGKKVGKGIAKVILRDEITHNDYINVLNTNEGMNNTQITIRSLHHQLYTTQTNKKL